MSANAGEDAQLQRLSNGREGLQERSTSNNVSFTMKMRINACNQGVQLPTVKHVAYDHRQSFPSIPHSEYPASERSVIKSLANLSYCNLPPHIETHWP
jgi:hypothetical protein